MRLFNHNTRYSLGFSLVELSVLLALLATLTGMFITLAGKQKSTTQYEETRAKLEVIEKALQRELLFTGYLPCPAGRTQLPNAALYNLASNCNAGAPADVTHVSTMGGTADDIRIGTLPTRTLNLPDTYAVDAWGMRFTYAVVRDLAKSKTNFNDYVPPAVGNRLTVNNRSGTSLVATAPADVANSTVAYVVVSHGADKKGATIANGSVTNACTAGFLDTENCNHLTVANNRIFIQTNVTDDLTRPTTFFDDVVVWKPYHLIAPALK
jgi:type II secretory pathway pseudopilin PulG